MWKVNTHGHVNAPMPWTCMFMIIILTLNTHVVSIPFLLWSFAYLGYQLLVVTTVPICVDPYKFKNFHYTTVKVYSMYKLIL